ncbi:hypothetical protein Sta7437_4635 (plasmid) [Stanieria cyanosphaera PCC 7437]|uniref:Uncharacterized protein n=1 Tax=Stanieria cyanosphaera (strain ATCC 29371 / PCC 7437) TaxID=111780 RepID=K9Y290_STAC7|nr:hypothetical protein [Stanieria cyanosphaera]AFZ38092.1 hypothetical protein Sta7437_4635 [Stanieria cyanosphaera PCC 7437]
MPIGILKYNRALLTRPDIIFCGRKIGNPELIGLGNPFSHKPNSNAVFIVNSLEESLMSYRLWLWKSLKTYRKSKISTLELWEMVYLNRFLHLAILIGENKVSGLMCFCTNINNYKYSKNKEIKCHVQILYRACIWLNNNSHTSNKN